MERFSLIRVDGREPELGWPIAAHDYSRARHKGYGSSKHLEGHPDLLMTRERSEWTRERRTGIGYSISRSFPCISNDGFPERLVACFERRVVCSVRKPPKAGSRDRLAKSKSCGLDSRTSRTGASFPDRFPFLSSATLTNCSQMLANTRRYLQILFSFDPKPGRIRMHRSRKRRMGTMNWY